MRATKAIIYYAGFLKKSGGAFMHARTIAEELKSRGWSVEIVTLDKVPAIFRYLPHLAQHLGNILVPPLGFFFKDRLTRKLYKAFHNADANLRIFEDIYISWESDTPSVTLLHAVWSDNLQSLTVTDEAIRPLLRREARVLGGIRHPIVTVSEPYRRFLVEHHFSGFALPPLAVIPLGVSQSGAPQNGRTQRAARSIVYCGSLEPRKNVFFLLKVFKKLVSDHGIYALTIIGDGPDMEGLQAFATDHALDVRFLGRLDHDSVIEELRRHSIYLHTSVKESFSFALLEAKLAGLSTCAYQGLQVPSEFIDAPVGSFEIDDWCSTVASISPPSEPFDGSRYTSVAMTNDTLRLVRAAFPNSSLA